MSRIAELLATDPVVDGHNDLMWECREQAGYDFSRLSLGTGNPTTQTDLPRLRAGGVGAQFWSVWVGTSLTGGDAVTATLEQIDGVRRLIDTYPDHLTPARTADDIEAAWRQGRIASLMGAEGGHQIDCSLATLRMLFDVGVRYLTLTHNANVPWADSATDVPRAGGLSPFGHEVVREMNRLGMMVDLSHVSADTMRDAIGTSQAPVIFSHSSARAVCDSPRNVPDDVLAALPGNGGLCMVTFVPQFVSPEVAAWYDRIIADAAAEGIALAQEKEFGAFFDQARRADPQPPCSLEDVVRHVEHVREVAGVDHLGLGGDYDGVEVLPTGLEDVSGYPRLLAALADRGWSDGDLGKLTNRNLLRVMREVDDRSASLRQQRGPSTATFAELG